MLTAGFKPPVKKPVEVETFADLLDDTFVQTPSPAVDAPVDVSPLDVPDRWCEPCWSAYADSTMSGTRPLTPCALVQARSTWLVGPVRPNDAKTLAEHIHPMFGPRLAFFVDGSKADYVYQMDRAVNQAFASERRAVVVVSEAHRMQSATAQGDLRRLLDVGYRLGVSVVMLSSSPSALTNPTLTAAKFGVRAVHDRDKRVWATTDAAGRESIRGMRLR